MNALLKKILNKHGIKIFGIISMPPVRDWLECRAVQRIPKNAKILIPCIFPYYIGDIPRNISLYAIIPDYHQVVTSLLQAACADLQEHFAGRFEAFVDNSPFPEVACAQRAGLGVRGENALLINETYGSYIFIGEISTDFAFEPEEFSTKECLQCGKCAAACPGSAICNHKIDVSRCLSFLTQKKGELSAEETALIRKGSLIWGCDLCQLACPMNRHVKKTTITQFYEDVFPYLTMENFPKKVRKRAFGFRGRRVLERNLAIFDEK